MDLKIGKEQVPLLADSDGVVRVNGSRVTLDTIIDSFKEGATADEIALRFPVISLADIYSILSFYLRHRQDVEKYLEQREQTTKKILKEAESMFPRDDVRRRLIARRAKTG